MTVKTIGGVVATAPLFNKVKPESLRDMVNLLDHASYHYADDSGKEWGSAGDALHRFAETVNVCKLSYSAIVCLHRDHAAAIAAALLKMGEKA